MALKARNSTVSDIALKEPGITVPASSTYSLNASEITIWADAIQDGSSQLNTLLTSGDIVIEDDGVDLSATEGSARLLNNRAKKIYFNNDTNGFAAFDVQVGIEEAKGINSNIGRTFVISFENNGSTGNKWLIHSSGASSDILPYHTSFDLQIYGISMLNQNLEKDVDIEFYKNGTAPGDLIYTLQVRLGVSNNNAHITTVSSLFDLLIGDEISVFIRKVGGDALASPVIDIFCRISSNNVGSEGLL